MDQLPVSKLEIEGIASPRGLVLLGDVDSHTASSLQEALDAFDPDADVTVDMEKVDFVDSTGLRVLVAQHQRLTDADHRLVLANPSGAVNRLLAITGLSGTLHTTGGPGPTASG